MIQESHLNFAEVTLTLDNEDQGACRLIIMKLVLQEGVYRSGESEFYINNKQHVD